MAFDRPTLSELVARAQTDIETRLSGADAKLRFSVENVLARIVAGMAHGAHGHLVWLSRQLFPDSAEAEYLDRWAGIWGLARKAAVASSGDVVFTGTNGTDIPAGTALDNASGAEYTTDALVTIAAGTATVAVTASEPGVDGDMVSGQTLTLVTPISGCDADATVDTGGITGGTDQEDDADLRARVLQRIQNSPKGGGAGDYERWALEVAGVTRAWQIPQGMGPGTVLIYFARDDDASPIPDAGEVATVQAYVEDLAPVTCEVTVAAPAAKTMDMTITVYPNTAAVKAAVQTELEDMLRRDGEPSGTIYLSQIRAAISQATGEEWHVLTSPAADVVMASNEIPVLGTITWGTP